MYMFKFVLRNRTERIHCLQPVFSCITLIEDPLDPWSNDMANPSFKVDWYRVPIEKSILKQLNRKSDIKGFMQAGGYLAIVTATAVLCLYVWTHLPWPWLIPALYLHGTVSAFMINGVHELIHGTVFKTRWLNDRFAQILAFLGWINHYGFKASHMEHHKFTLHHPHDREVVLPIRFTLKGILNGALANPISLFHVFKGTARVACGGYDNDWTRQVVTQNKRERIYHNWARFLMLGHVSMAVVSIIYGYWIIPVLISATPTYGRLLFRLCNETQHVGLQERVTDFRLNCRTIYLNPVVQFLYWHMNYHIEHHMYASVPCYNLGKLHRRIQSQLPEIPNGLADTWFQIIGILWRQSKEPDYQYVPELPNESCTQSLADITMQKHDASVHLEKAV